MKIALSFSAVWLVLFYAFTTPKPNTVPVSDGFDYPVGFKGYATEAKDGKDHWYNARDFRSKNHLGEDWNKNSGGNTDCGWPVRSASNGLVIYAKDAGPGWGNVIIIRHRLPDGKQVESLYGHLRDLGKKKGETVKKGEKIGAIGDGKNPCGDSKPYYAHLHFEIRKPNCRDWGIVYDGYAKDATGWIDPSRFIDKHRRL